MRSIAEAGIWLALTKALPPMPAIALMATRRPLTSSSVSRFFSCTCAPPAVFWLVLLALDAPVLPRPWNSGIALRSSSSTLGLTPEVAIFSALISITETATASRVVGTLEPVTMTCWGASGASAGAAGAVAGASSAANAGAASRPSPRPDAIKVANRVR